MIHSYIKRRPFACKICDRRFLQKEHLSDHVRTIHRVRLSEYYKERSEEVLAARQAVLQKKPYFCHCGTRFAQKESIRRHLNQVHKIPVDQLQSAYLNELRSCSDQVG